MELLPGKRLKILICAFACLKDPDRRFGLGEGGEGVLGWNLTLQLARFFDVWVLTHPSNKEAIEKSNISGINFYYVDIPKFLHITKKRIQIYAYLWQIWAYFAAKKLHRKVRFDAFHHLTYANDWMASFIGALLKIPYVRGPGGGAHHVPPELVKEYLFKEKLTETIRRAGQWIFRHDPFFIISQKRSKAILVCNQEAFNALAPDWQKKAHFFPVNGVSLNDINFLAKEVKKNSENFLVLSAGKLIKIKGFDLAIRSFKKLSDISPKARLMIVGEGPEELSLKKLVADLGLEQKVIFSGWLPRESLLGQMMECDIFLFASLRDGGGNVVVEAMAAGKPVVCVDAAGPGFHVQEGWGIKVKVGAMEQVVNDLGKALVFLYQNDIARERLGRSTRSRAESFYDWNKLGDRLFEIYSQILTF